MRRWFYDDSERHMARKPSRNEAGDRRAMRQLLATRPEFSDLSRMSDAQVRARVLQLRQEGKLPTVRDGGSAENAGAVLPPAPKVLPAVLAAVAPATPVVAEPIQLIEVKLARGRNQYINHNSADNDAALGRVVAVTARLNQPKAGALALLQPTLASPQEVRRNRSVAPHGVPDYRRRRSGSTRPFDAFKKTLQEVILGSNGILLIEALDWRAPLLKALLFTPPSPLKIPMPASKVPPLPDLATRHIPKHSTVAIALDLRKLKEPLPPGRYTLTVLEYDWKSNTTVIELVDAGKSPAPAPAIWVDGATTEFQMSSTTPANTAPGITLDVPITWSKRSASFQLQGHLRLPVERSWLTAASAPNSPQAEIPAHLVLVEKNVLWPQRTDFTIPVRSPKPLRRGGEISATLRLDIKQLFDRPATPGSYMAYVFTGATVTGPFPVQLKETP